MYHRWGLRIHREGFTDLSKAGCGRPTKVHARHIAFLKRWLSRKKNAGKSFKLAFNALKQEFKDDLLHPISFKQRTCME